MSSAQIHMHTYKNMNGNTHTHTAGQHQQQQQHETCKSYLVASAQRFSTLGCTSFV